MLVLFHALQEAIGAITPWGALTGVRPTKMVREWLESGQTSEDAFHALTSTFKVHEDRARLALEVAIAENKLAKRILTDHNPIGLYVSIPFCPTRCIYCSFNTALKPWSTEMQRSYVNALISEIEDLPRKLSQEDGHVSSIYIGGGTPTALDNDLLEKLLARTVEIAGSPVEFTVEAGRPDTITRENLNIMRNYGVNRISINPQTVNDVTLQAIGRKHTNHDFLNAFALARETGFACINTDIIAGLPGEDAKDMARTMETLAALQPENITIHTLAIKRASKLNEERAEKDRHGMTRRQSTDAISAQLKVAHEACTAAGLSPYYLYRQKNMAALYENTGFSLPGHECLYNIGMMSEIQTVLGIGAGAVSKFVKGSLITREFNPKNPEIYIERRNPQ